MSNEHDRAILNCIFNPLLPVGESLNDEETQSTIQDEEEEETRENIEARALEVEAIKMAESGDVSSALSIFSRAIGVAPLRASTFNNRAQAHRLAGDMEGAVADVDRAVELSGGRGGVARQALCQRGVLRRGRGQDAAAREDFHAAAALGSSFAKSQLVEMNPYAALCNQMLHEVMGKLK